MFVLCILFAPATCSPSFFFFFRLLRAPAWPATAHKVTVPRFSTVYPAESRAAVSDKRMALPGAEGNRKGDGRAGGSGGDAKRRERAARKLEQQEAEVAAGVDDVGALVYLSAHLFCRNNRFSQYSQVNARCCCCVRALLALACYCCQPVWSPALNVSIVGQGGGWTF